MGRFACYNSISGGWSLSSTLGNGNSDACISPASYSAPATPQDAIAIASLATAVRFVLLTSAILFFLFLLLLFLFSLLLPLFSCFSLSFYFIAFVVSVLCV